MMNSSTLPSLESASSKSTTCSFATAFICLGFASVKSFRNELLSKSLRASQKFYFQIPTRISCSFRHHADEHTTLLPQKHRTFSTQLEAKLFAKIRSKMSSAQSQCRLQTNRQRNLSLQM